MTNALEEALKLVLAGKRGKPCKAVIHIPFEELLALPGASAMMAAYTGHAAASAATGGGDGGTWLAGDQAIAILPDAIIVPVVMTRLAAEHMETISSIGAELHRLAAEDQADAQAQAQAADAPAAGHDAPPAGPATAGTDAAAQAERDTRAQRMTDLRHQLAGEVIASVSGPDAVAAWLRRGLLGTPGTGPLSLALAGKSLPSMSGTPGPSRPRSAWPQRSARRTARPRAAPSPPSAARPTTSSTARTAAPPASRTATPTAGGTTRSSSTGWAGPPASTATAPPPSAGPTAPSCPTGPPPGHGNQPSARPGTTRQHQKTSRHPHQGDGRPTRPQAAHTRPGRLEQWFRVLEPPLTHCNCWWPQL